MAKDTGLIHEGGDRWKLDLLIPDRDRRLVGPQIPHTSRQRVATKARVATDYHIDPSLRYHTPIYSAIETTLDAQRRMRGGDIALPGDRLL